LKDLFEFLSHFHTNAPPFISENEDGSYSLVGSSDLAIYSEFDYGELGRCKLTAKNHTKTLLALMNFIVTIDEISENEMLSLDDEEVIGFIEFQFSEILTNYFGFFVKFDQNLALSFLNNHKELVNEALYNITKDKDLKVQRDYNAIDDSLDGQQFQDPYVGIAYQVAKAFKIRPLDVVNDWSTAELIVTFAKLENDNSLDSYISWKYSQKNAPKRSNPRKQMFYFEEVDDGSDDESEVENGSE